MSRLQQFYGGSPCVWLNETPVALLKAMLEMLPRLQAEAQLNHIEAVSIAFGSYGKSDTNRVVSELSKKAFGHTAKSMSKSPPNPAALAAMGIGMTTVAPSQKEEVSDNG